jgi:hypothetical protein
MSEHHFRIASKPTRTASYTLLSLLLGCACQSESPPPEATPTTTESSIAAPVVTAAAPDAVLSPSATNAALAAAEAAATAQPSTAGEVAGKDVAKVPAAKPGEVKPVADAKSGKADETAKGETPSPSPAPDAPKDSEPVIEKPCLAKSFEFPAVSAACKKGGVPKAKALMKAWTNKAKEKGESYKCATCHDNQKTYSNKPSADADLRKLLAIIK